MHILLIPSWYPKTVDDISGSFFREQALALKKNGCKVGVISFCLRSLRDLRSLFGGSYNISFEDDLSIITYRKYGFPWFYRMPKMIAWLWKKNVILMFEQYLEKHGKPDIIHVHSMLYAGCPAKVISEKYKIPYVVTEHSTAFSRGLITSSKKKIIVQIAESAAKRFAVSRPFCDHLESFFKESHIDWDVMPNMVHNRFFKKISRHDDSKQFVFINVALLTAKKGIGVLIKAFAKTFSFHSNIKLKIGGDGPDRALLEMLAYELGVADKVEFLGMLSRDMVVDQMSQSDAFVLSSFNETFGVVLIEAMALGKPVIATICGGPEGIVRKKDGILVPANDVDALAAAMLRFYNNKDDYQSEEIRTACHARYSEQAIAEKLIQVYSEVLGIGLQSNAKVL